MAGIKQNIGKYDSQVEKQKREMDKMGDEIGRQIKLQRNESVSKNEEVVKSVNEKYRVCMEKIEKIQRKIEEGKISQEREVVVCE